MTHRQLSFQLVCNNKLLAAELACRACDCGQTKQIKRLRSTCSCLCRLNRCIEKILAFYLSRFYCTLPTMNVVHVNSGNLQIIFQFTALLMCVCVCMSVCSADKHTEWGKEILQTRYRDGGQYVFFFN